jgi:hypothetical protein
VKFTPEFFETLWIPFLSRNHSFIFHLLQLLNSCPKYKCSQPFYIIRICSPVVRRRETVPKSSNPGSSSCIIKVYLSIYLSISSYISIYSPVSFRGPSHSPVSSEFKPWWWRSCDRDPLVCQSKLEFRVIFQDQRECGCLVLKNQTVFNHRGKLYQLQSDHGIV